MAPPAFAEPQLKDDYTPSIHLTIDAHPDDCDATAPAEPTAGAPRLYYEPPQIKEDTPGDYDPAKILEAIGYAFGVGALVGGALVFAFSRRPAVIADA